MNDPIKIYLRLARILYAVARPLDRLAGRLTRHARQLKEQQDRAAYEATMGPPRITEAGLYRDREGTSHVVRRNHEGWLDKLPWIVERDGRMDYTVDQWGRVWWHREHVYDLVERIA